MKKTKINRLYDLYVDNPAIKDQERRRLYCLNAQDARITDTAYPTIARI